MESEQLEKLILEKDVTMKAMSTCLVDMKENVASVETEIELRAKSNPRPLSSATRKGAISARTGDSYIETITSVCLRFAFLENAIAPYCCRDTVFMSLFPLL